jgi:hypothetical protein
MGAGMGGGCCGVEVDQRFVELELEAVAGDCKEGCTVL